MKKEKKENHRFNKPVFVSSFLSIGDQRKCCASCAVFCVNNADTKIFFDGNTVYEEFLRENIKNKK